MAQVPISYHYDAEADVFSAWLRQPTEVLSTEVSEGIVIRTDANTDEFVGYTIIDLSRQFSGIRPNELTIPLVPESTLGPLRAQLEALQPLMVGAA
jgi:hypothetical protein